MFEHDNFASAAADTSSLVAESASSQSGCCCRPLINSQKKGVLPADKTPFTAQYRC